MDAMGFPHQETADHRAGELSRTLLDRAGRLWRWVPDLARRPGATPGVFRHQDQLRTEQEIENEAEPIIEVRDPRLLTAHLIPVPANQIRLNDWVVLPGLGELSPVIGIYPCPEQHIQRRWICTDNGDWARRADQCPVLRADPPQPVPFLAEIGADHGIPLEVGDE
jgi:hypothetical protein